MGLTTKRIAKLRRRRGRFHDGHGLYLQVLSKNSASWIFRYVRHGKERMLGLGPILVVGLKEARERAKASRSNSSMASIRSRTASRKRSSAPLLRPGR